MIEPTAAETRQHYRDRGNQLPSDYDLEQRYGNATIGAAQWLGRESTIQEEDVMQLIQAVRERAKEHRDEVRRRMLRGDATRYESWWLYTTERYGEYRPMPGDWTDDSHREWFDNDGVPVAGAKEG